MRTYEWNSSFDLCKAFVYIDNSLKLDFFDPNYLIFRTHGHLLIHNHLTKVPWHKVWKVWKFYFLQQNRRGSWMEKWVSNWIISGRILPLLFLIICVFLLIWFFYFFSFSYLLLDVFYYSNRLFHAFILLW